MCQVPLTFLFKKKVANSLRLGATMLLLLHEEHEALWDELLDLALSRLDNEENVAGKEQP